MKKKVITIGIVGIFLLLQPISAQTWLPTKRITWSSGGSFSPAIALDSSNNIHIVWSDIGPGNYEIFYKKSIDGGVTWAPSKRLTWNSGWTGEPDIAVDSSNNIHVVWDDDTSGNYEIFYKKSTNGGVSWTTRRLTWNTGGSYSPAISVDSSSNIHVTWFDETPGNQEIFYKKSTNGGVSWVTRRLTWNSEISFSPAISVDSSSNIHVTWVDDTPGNYEIYYKKSTDEGSTWSGAKRLTWNSGSSTLPGIAVNSSDNIHVIWTDSAPGYLDIYFRKSTDGGITWSWAKNLTANSGDSDSPEIALDSSNNIHVVWYDNTPGNYEIYYKRSTDGGASWTTKRLSWNSEESHTPTLVTFLSNTIHIVWSDDAPGNFEIFYRKGIQ